MHRIRNLTLLAVAWGLLLSTMVGSVTVEAAVRDADSPPAVVNPTEPASQITPASNDNSDDTTSSASSSIAGLSIPAWILWPIGLVELWLVGWIGIWSVALVGARRFLFEVDSLLRNVTFGRIPFGGDEPLTLAHLTLVRAFAQHPWVADEWLARHSQAITNWLSIDSRGVEPRDRDILVRIEGQAIAIADAPTVRAILPETPFVLTLHGEGRQWNERVLNIVLGQSMHFERASRLMPHQTIPVVLDRNCVERFQTKGKPASDMPYWLQVVRNELCRVPGLAASLDADLLMCLVKSRRILPIVDQWSQTSAGFQNALQTAVSSGELPCLVVLDDSDTIAEMKCVIRARSLKSPDFVAHVPTRVPASATKSGPGSRASSRISSPLTPRTFDKNAVPLLVQSLDDSVADVRVAAAQTLGGLGTSAREAVSQLATLLNDPVTACRQAAVNALGAIGPEASAATESLTKAVVNDHRKVRAAACRTLGAIGRPDGSVLNALVAAMNDKDAAVRSQAARSLGGLRVGQPEIVTVLAEALSDESAEVRSRAVSAISAIPEAINESIGAVVAAVADPVAEVRREVVAALGNVSRSRNAIIQTLVHSLTDPDAETRSRAATSLSRFGQESRPAIPELARLIGDSVTEVRRSAVEALDSIGVPSLESVSALEEATRDTDVSVRSAATTALQRVMPAAAAA
jgi:HEAT repeat protein